MYCCFAFLSSKGGHPCKEKVSGIVTVFHRGLLLNPIALRKTKSVYNFGLSECNRVKE